MGDDHAALGDIRRDLRQLARDIFVGQAVEAVSPDAFLIELIRQRVAVGDFGMAAVKAGVEACDLRQLRLPLQQGADRAEIVRLVERRKRGEGLKPLDHGSVDQSWGAVVGAAMHHAVADGDGQRSDLGAQEFDQPAQGSRHVGHLGGGPGLVDQDFAPGALGNDMRTDSDALDLALEPALQPIAPADREQLELDARAAGVDDEDGVGHGRQTLIGCFSIWLWR